MIYTLKQFSVEQSIRNFIGSILVLLQESGCECGSHVGILDVKNMHASLIIDHPHCFVDVNHPYIIYCKKVNVQGGANNIYRPPGACRPTIGRQGGLSPSGRATGPWRTPMQNFDVSSP